MFVRSVVNCRGQYVMTLESIMSALSHRQRHCTNLCWRIHLFSQSEEFSTNIEIIFTQESSLMAPSLLDWCKCQYFIRFWIVMSHITTESMRLFWKCLLAACLFSLIGSFCSEGNVLRCPPPQLNPRQMFFRELGCHFILICISLVRRFIWEFISKYSRIMESNVTEAMTV